MIGIILDMFKKNHRVRDEIELHDEENISRGDCCHYQEYSCLFIRENKICYIRKQTFLSRFK